MRNIGEFVISLVLLVILCGATIAKQHEQRKPALQSPYREELQGPALHLHGSGTGHGNSTGVGRADGYGNQRQRIALFGDY